MIIRLRNFLQHAIILTGIAVLSPAAYAGSIEEIKAALTDLIGPRAANSEVIESPMEGVYQVNLGDRVIYASKVGNHMLLGEVYDTERKVSLADELQQQKALATIESMNESEMIVFSPEQTKRTMTVYTDVDCPYCRKLHKEVPELVENGVKVRYLWFPRSGINTPSYDKAVSIWCADDQQAAMDDAKLNDKIVAAKCDPNPVSTQYASGQQVGVRGTPTIVLDDGTVIGGYMPAKNLLADMGIEIKASK